MKIRLTLPTRLVVSVTLAAGCSSPTSNDAGADVPTVTDRGTTDALDAVADVIADALTDAAADAVADVAADRHDACVMNPFSGESGIACRPRASAPAGTTCPDRACTAADCPAAACESCDSPLFCIPDREADVTAQCSTTTCDPAACPAGCRAVG